MAYDPTRPSYDQPDEILTFKVNKSALPFGLIFSPMLPKIEGSLGMNLPIALCLVAAVVLVAVAMLGDV